MRVALLSVSDKLGGSEAMLLQVLREVRRARPAWRFGVVVPGTGPLAAAAAREGADVRVVPMPPDLLRLGEWAAAGRRSRLAWQLVRAGLALPGYERRLAATLTAFGADVLHSNGFKSHIAAARAARRPALVWHVHEYVSTRPLTRRLLRHHRRRADLIVVNSSSVARDVSSALGVPVATIPNAVDVAQFGPDGPRADLDGLSGLAPAPDGTVRVGLIATFSRWKGHRTFLEALERLDPALPIRGYVIGGAVYDTAGSQYDLAELRAMATALGLEGRAGFTGFVSPAEHAIRALDVVVHASTEPEAFGLVIAEAMACGRPVVTSGTGGVAELIVEGETALRYEPGNASALASALARLCAEPALRARLGRQARARALRLFDAARLGEQFAAAYERALEARARR